MNEEIKEGLEFIGEKYAQGLISNTEGQIRDIQKVISMIQNIKIKMDIIDGILKAEIEQSLANIAACKEKIAGYLSSKKTYEQNIYSLADKKVSLLAVNSVDREFFEKLNEIGTEVGIDQDISLAADKLKSLTTVIETLRGIGAE